MTTYAGTCVGGPMDRMHIETFDTMLARIAKPYNFNPEDPWRADVDPHEVVLDVFEYRHHEIEFRGPGESVRLGFWIPMDTRGDPTRYVIEALAVRYRQGQ